MESARLRKRWFTKGIARMSRPAIAVAATARSLHRGLCWLSTRTAARTAMARKEPRDSAVTRAARINAAAAAATQRSLGREGKSANATANANGGSRNMASALGLVLRNAGAPLTSRGSFATEMAKVAIWPTAIRQQPVPAILRNVTTSSRVRSRSTEI